VNCTNLPTSREEHATHDTATNTVKSTSKKEYESYRQSAGMQISIASHKRIVGDAVRDKLFAKVKFLSDENEMEYNGKLQK
jgi:hypothetical protein